MDEQRHLVFFFLVVGGGIEVERGAGTVETEAVEAGEEAEATAGAEARGRVAGAG